MARREVAADVDPSRRVEHDWFRMVTVGVVGREETRLAVLDKVIAVLLQQRIVLARDVAVGLRGGAVEIDLYAHPSELGDVVGEGVEETVGEVTVCQLIIHQHQRPQRHQQTQELDGEEYRVD